MNEEIIRNKWQEIKEKLKDHWGNIKDDDIAQMDGSYHDLKVMLQIKYGYQKFKAEKEIESFIKHYGWDV